MGKLKIRFQLEGVDIEQLPIETTFDKHLQSFQIKYNTDKMCEIEIEGDDFTIDFDINNLSWDMDWEKLIYPNEIVKGKVIEIVYYKSIAEKLKDVKDEIIKCSFEDRYKLENFVKKAIDIISNTTENVYLNGILFYKTDRISAINHTLNKEVVLLTKYIKYKDSQIKKDMALSDAIRHLSDDIESVIFSFEKFDVNK